MTDSTLFREKRVFYLTTGASPVAQMVKNLPAIQETLV